MSPFAFASIETIPLVLQLAVGLLGLIVSVKGRARGVSGLMVAAFAIMLATTVLAIVWQFVALNVPDWSESGGLSIDGIRTIYLAVALVFDIASLLSWLLVAIAVVKSGRFSRPQQGFAPPASYPMGGQPGYPAAQPGYAPPAPPQQAQQPTPPAQQPPS
ncbi:hypothetical protein [Amycolatopsis sp. EV170708-02-1]|uniref:hypothetical protein n=1 Tax=Amycolatopsis sp. EV170708-02-1 TaxID=2919322 RepID=UPI001F0BA79C|nr:hypothetical protein [Amycolatopsis sp. EV170708-02-1]UMP05263.1 hypothetical protein MJQ72_10710 [Amycolatopsis sp. EV170708-02-1]